MSTDERVEVVSVERIDGSEIIVELSDGTSVVLTTQQVLDCAVERLPASSPGDDENE